MRNSVKLILSISLMWGIISGCSKDDASGLGGHCGNGMAWFELVSDESVKVTEAASAYSVDSNAENCQNYKAAYADYIRALKEVSQCVLGPGQSAYQQSLKSAEIEIDQICQ